MLTLPLGMFIGLLLASYLKNLAKGSKVLRLIYYLPAVSSAVAINIIWRYIFDMDYGILNVIFGTNVPWLGTSNKWLIRIAIMIKNTWSAIGGTMLLYLAGLNSISESYYEAAEIDGANKFQKFFKITVPLLSSTTFYLLVVGLIGGLQEFTRFQAINSVNSNLISPTGPDNAGLTIVFYLYNKAFLTNGGLGIAAATSWLLAILTTIITIINFKFSKRWVYDG